MGAELDRDVHAIAVSRRPFRQTAELEPTDYIAEPLGIECRLTVSFGLPIPDLTDRVRLQIFHALVLRAQAPHWQPMCGVALSHPLLRIETRQAKLEEGYWCETVGVDAAPYFGLPTVDRLRLLSAPRPTADEGLGPL